ncbi:MAG: 30S ribosomal protein S17, partial [Candidatus Saccharimonadales bacterium]
VSVQTRKTHPLYKKQYTSTKRYAAHDEKNEAKVGDKVEIAETKPISATKHFTLTKIVEKAQIKASETVEKVTAKDDEEAKEVKQAPVAKPKNAEVRKEEATEDKK